MIAGAARRTSDFSPEALRNGITRGKRRRYHPRMAEDKGK